jgi:tetratricopeptide (TPR) repeat protein
LQTSGNAPAAGRIAGGFFFTALLLLAGCSHTVGQQLSQLRATDLAPTAEIRQTPFFPQERYQCGPAALATMLTSTGINTDAEQLVPQVYLPEREGSLQAELLAATRRQDRLPYVISPKMEDLLREISDGRPVLVLQNLGLSWHPKWHYAVVVGYDLESQRMVLRSGTTRRKTMSMSLFDHTWRRSNRWAMVVISPEDVPATATETSYLRTVLAFEQTRKWNVANTAYRAAASHWPGSLGAVMGVGNTYYQMGKKSDAEQAYRTALSIDSNHAPAHNNLAQVLLERHRLTEALVHARQAVAIGGPMQDSYKQTLDEIERKLK